MWVFCGHALLRFSPLYFTSLLGILYSFIKNIISEYIFKEKNEFLTAVLGKSMNAYGMNES